MVIKGKSFLNELKYYFPIESTVIDYMHSVVEGVAKKLMIYWFLPEYSNEPFSLRQHFSKINKMIKSIRVPQFVPRTPRDLNEFKKWKANEIFSFFVFYSLPIFRGLMEEGQFNHLVNLVVSIEYLLQPHLEEEFLDQI